MEQPPASGPAWLSIVGPGDLVWTSPITFVASANCALYCGAEVDFVEYSIQEPNNLSPKRLEEKTQNSKKLLAVCPRW